MSDVSPPISEVFENFWYDPNKGTAHLAESSYGAYTWTEKKVNTDDVHKWALTHWLEYLEGLELVRKNESLYRVLFAGLFDSKLKACRDENRRMTFDDFKVKDLNL